MMAQQENRAWTIRDLMKFTIDHFHRQGFSEARLNIELLLSHALACNRIDLYTHFDKPLSKEELSRFRSLYERRLAHEPVQHIVGGTSFMGLHFVVDRRALIPRPETETVVEQLMLLCGERGSGQLMTILEIGTGSGNIAVAAAKLIRNIHVTTMEVSADALEVARMNAAAHGVEDLITFLHCDVFSSPLPQPSSTFDVLVSNPPYVSVQEWAGLEPEVRDYEPKGALSDMHDGYRFYDRIIELLPGKIRSGGAIIVEVGHGQAQQIVRLFAAAGIEDVKVVNDLQGVPRVVRGRWGSEIV